MVQHAGFSATHSRSVAFLRLAYSWFPEIAVNLSPLYLECWMYD